MFRHTHYIIAIAVLAVLPLAHAGTPAVESRTVEPVPSAEVTEPATEVTTMPIADEAKIRADLATLFLPEEESVETSNGVSATITTGEILLARIGPDGKVVMACVDNKEAAVRFLAGPVERTPGARKAAKK
jgi:hypothetical protein